MKAFRDLLLLTRQYRALPRVGHSQESRTKPCCCQPPAWGFGCSPPTTPGWAESGCSGDAELSVQENSVVS